MPSDASAVVPVNVANGCLIHKRCVSFFNAVTVPSNDAVVLFARSPASQYPNNVPIDRCFFKMKTVSEVAIYLVA